MSILLDFLFPRFCYGCGRPGFNLCSACVQSLSYHNLIPGQPPFEGVLSLFDYRPPVSSLIKQLKFKFITDLVDDIVSLSVTKLKSGYPNLLDYWRQNNFIFCPIPLHPRRLLWRGFNQSEIIGFKLSQSLGLKYDPNLLIRSKFTKPQSTLASGSYLRSLNVSGSFQLINPSPPNLILFDDVSTTLSTLKSAAAIFPSQDHLWAFTLASKL